jgi:cytochrome c oxidase accessory protein FixG
VQVCPTGIDIRKGLQYECIACAACIDACDTVMDKMSYPRGLIRYTTQNALEHKPTRVMRPRVVIYAALLTLLISLFGVGLWKRTPVEVDVIRDRNALYRLNDNGRVENVYNVKILNKTESAHRFRITVQGAGDLRLETKATFDVASGEVFPAAIRVSRSAYEPLGAQDVEFVVQAEDNARLRAQTDARFLAPTR